MPCKRHAEELEGHSDDECEACALDDKAEEAYWFQLYQGEKQAGLLEPVDTKDPRNPEYWGL